MLKKILILKFFVCFLPEDNVLRRSEELTFLSPLPPQIKPPFTHAGCISHWSSGMTFHRSPLRRNLKKAKDGGEKGEESK